MTYIVLKDKPSPGYYTIMNTDDSLIWQQQAPAMSEASINKMADILTEANPTNGVAVSVCRMILGKSTEIGSKWTYTTNNATNNTFTFNTDSPSI